MACAWFVCLFAWNNPEPLWSWAWRIKLLTLYPGASRVHKHWWFSMKASLETGPWWPLSTGKITVDCVLLRDSRCKLHRLLTWCQWIFRFIIDVEQSWRIHQTLAKFAHDLTTVPMKVDTQYHFRISRSKRFALSGYYNSETWTTDAADK